MKNRLEALLLHPWFGRTIMTLIILNAITLGLETSQTVMNSVGPLLIALDRAFLAVFVLEIAIDHKLQRDFEDEHGQEIATIVKSKMFQPSRKKLRR